VDALADALADALVDAKTPQAWTCGARTRSRIVQRVSIQSVALV
jgi:hypothetical protein